MHIKLHAAKCTKTVSKDCTQHDIVRHGLLMHCIRSWLKLAQYAVIMMLNAEAHTSSIETRPQVLNFPIGLVPLS